MPSTLALGWWPVSITNQLHTCQLGNGQWQNKHRNSSIKDHIYAQKSILPFLCLRIWDANASPSFEILLVCKFLPTASNTNLAIGIIWRLEDAFTFVPRKESTLQLAEREELNRSEANRKRNTIMAHDYRNKKHKWNNLLSLTDAQLIRNMCTVAEDVSLILLQIEKYINLTETK